MSPRLFLALLCCVLWLTMCAQSVSTPSLVRDFSSSLSDLTVLGTRIFFVSCGGVANDGVPQCALWYYDTADGTTHCVKALQSATDPAATSMAALGEYVYFPATSEETGRELWRTDGTTTTLVADLRPGTASSDPIDLTSCDGKLYFCALGSTGTTVAFQSDGTAAGTIELGGPSSLGAMVAYQGTVYFAGKFAGAGMELGRIEGNTAALFHNIDGGNGDSTPANITVFNGRLYFTATGSAGSELYWTDGSTVTLHDLNTAGSSNPGNFVTWGGYLYFTATSGTNTLLWRTNGAETCGSVVVKRSGVAMSMITALCVMGGKLYFAGKYGTSGSELHVTVDGAVATLVKDIQFGSGSSTPQGLTAVGNLLYFTADDGKSGRELYRSDGTATGTTQVTNLNGAGTTQVTNLNGAGSANVGQMLPVNGRLAFTSAAADSSLPDQIHLVAADGQSAPAVVAWANRTLSSFTPFHGATYFAARNQGSGYYELWRTDGSRTGTVFLRDMNPATDSASPLCVVGDTLYFTAYDASTGTELYRTDGTTFTLVADLNMGTPSANPTELVAVGGKLCFVANTQSAGAEVCVSDGTAGGTSVLADLRLANDITYPPHGLTVVNRDGVDWLFFSAVDSSVDWELCVSDGIVGSSHTVQVLRADGKEINGSGSSDPRYLCALNGTLYCAAEEGTYGRELWRATYNVSKGKWEAAIAADINPGFAPSTPEDLVVVGETLYCAATNNGSTRGLWRYVGGVASSVACPGVDPDGLTPLNGALLFTATEGGQPGLYVNDGTSNGTQKLGTFSAVQADSLVAVGGLVFFAATQNPAVDGMEPWVTDGTAAGTARLADLNSGPGNANPANFCALDATRIVFSASQSPLNATGLYKAHLAGNNPPTVTLEGTGAFLAGDQATVTAIAQDAEGTVTRVVFFENDTALGEDCTPADGFTYTWPAITAGVHTVTAVAFDDLGTASAPSPAITLTVGELAAPTALASSEVTFQSFRANWMPPAGIAGLTGFTYRLEISSDASMVGEVATVTDVDGLSRVVTGLTGGGYYYRVRAVRNGIVSAPSNIILATVLPPLSVSITASAGGTVQPAAMQRVTAGSDLTATAFPRAGYVVTGWVLDGMPTGVSSPTYTLANIQNSRTLVANFAQAEARYTVTASAVGPAGCTVTPATATVRQGGNVYLKATPVAGSSVAAWELVTGTTRTPLQQGGLVYELAGVTADATVEVTFTAVLPPAVSALLADTQQVTTLQAPNAGALTLTLVGSGFRAGATARLVAVGQPEITASSVAVADAGQMSCTFHLTRNAPGAWQLVVTNDDGQETTFGGTVELVPSAPRLVAIEPASGMAGTTVSLTDVAGVGFASDATITLEHATAPNLTVAAVGHFGSSRMTGTLAIPADATPGAYRVVVRNPGDGSPASAEAVEFTVTAAPAPVIAAITPDSADNAAAVVLTITGSDFTTEGLPAVTLICPGQPPIVGTVTAHSATAITVSLDLAGAMTGRWTVVVTNPDGQAVTWPQGFALTAPTLTAVGLSVDRTWPQLTGSAITLTATPTGGATDVQYAFFAKYYNLVTREWVVDVPVSNGYQDSPTCTWRPTTAQNYWLYVKARKADSSADYQAISPDLYFPIASGTLTGVSLTVPATATAGVPVTLQATKTGTAPYVEYWFIGYRQNATTGKWDFFDIRGYDVDATCTTWAPPSPGQYRLYVLARIVGSADTFQQVATPVTLTATN